MDVNTQKTLIEGFANDAYCTDLDIFALVLTKKVAASASTSALTGQSFLMLLAIVNAEVNAFKAEMAAENAAAAIEIRRKLATKLLM